MKKTTETSSNTVRHSLAFWVFRVAIRANVVFYLSEVVVKLIYEIIYSEVNVSLQSILLGTSRDWHLFLRIRVFMLIVGLLAAVIVWVSEPYWRKDD